MRIRLVAAGLAAMLVSGGAAQAAGMAGNPALAFAALVGQHAPALSMPHKLALSRFLNSQPNLVPPGASFVFHADLVHCHYSNVAISDHACTLTFGAATVNLSGRQANELLATMALAGVQADGAAGTIHFGITNVACAIDINAVKANGGGGAHCSYTPM